MYSNEVSVTGDLRGVAAVGAVRRGGAGGGRADADHAGDAEHAAAGHHPRGRAHLPQAGATAAQGTAPDDHQALTTHTTHFGCIQHCTLLQPSCDYYTRVFQTNICRIPKLTEFYEYC